MSKETVAVLEVGSQKITCVIGSRGVNNTFAIKSYFEQEYEGFSDGDFFDINSLSFAVKKTVSEAVKNSRGVMNKLYVSVPSEFCTVRTRDCSISFTRKRRVKESDVAELHNKLSLSKNSDYAIIDVAAVYYSLSDGRQTENPIGQISERLGGLLTYVLCDKYYCSLLTATCKSVKPFAIEFVSEALAESSLLLTEKKLNRILVDVGYLTTSFAVLKGNGIVYLKAFSYGGGYLRAALMEEFKITFEQAEQLKRKINLGYDKTDASGVYKLFSGDEAVSVPLQRANAVVRASLDNLAEQIEERLRECADLPENDVIALTGGGISFMRGAKEYLSTRLGYGLNVVAARVPLMSNPDEAACLSVLNLALSKQEGKVIY